MAAAGLLREEAMTQLQLPLGARAVPKRLAFAAMGENSAVSLRATALEAGNPRPRRAQGRRRAPSHHRGAEPAGRHQPPPAPSRPARLRPSPPREAPPLPAPPVAVGGRRSLLASDAARRGRGGSEEEEEAEVAVRVGSRW